MQLLQKRGRHVGIMVDAGKVWFYCGGLQGMSLIAGKDRHARSQNLILRSSNKAASRPLALALRDNYMSRIWKQ